MPLTVLYFAAAREQAGVQKETLDLTPRSVAELLTLLCQRHPGLEKVVPHLRVAVNQAFTQPADAIPLDAEVALIPPVAGGSGAFRILDEPLSLEDVVKAVSGPGAGGIVTFSGAVRGMTRGRRVVRLEYEAYVPMAQRTLEALGADVARQWPGTRLAIAHRVGILAPGDLAVVIAAGAPHRKEAFRACEYAIDRLKADAPIWKKEVYEDGEVWVGLGP